MATTRFDLLEEAIPPNTPWPEVQMRAALLEVRVAIESMDGLKLFSGLQGNLEYQRAQQVVAEKLRALLALADSSAERCAALDRVLATKPGLAALIQSFRARGLSSFAQAFVSR